MNCPLACLEINCLRTRTKLCLEHKRYSNKPSAELNCLSPIPGSWPLPIRFLYIAFPLLTELPAHSSLQNASTTRPGAFRFVTVQRWSVAWSRHKTESQHYVLVFPSSPLFTISFTLSLYKTVYHFFAQFYPFWINLPFHIQAFLNKYESSKLACTGHFKSPFLFSRFSRSS